MIFPPAPTDGLDFDPAEVTLDLTIAGNYEQGVVAKSSSINLLQNERTATSFSTNIHAGPQALGDTIDQGLTFMSTASTSTDPRASSDAPLAHQITTTDDATMDQIALAAPLLQFDATNWLLDEAFVDIEGVDFTWNELHDSHEQPDMDSSSLALAKESNNGPTVLDLRQMWYIQIRSNIDDLHDDYGSTGRQVVNSQRRDIDEIYRTNMAEGLRPALRNEALPSIDFLVVMSPIKR